ncbi:MAG TPA: heme o synthase [Candidatus Eisenbacteria bacterium]|nr:heme o synthase [Candidatus Eisenbacteria bacterium]
MKQKIKLYIALTKPGIIFGTTLSFVTGFYLASKGHIHVIAFLMTICGIALGLASACVFNNVVDRNIDAKMPRTKNRALARKLIPVPIALIFASILGGIGLFLLYTYTNILTVVLGFVGFVFYIILYGIAKRKSIHGTLVGAVAGALPLAAGYTAVTNRFDTGALLLFLILGIWQIPHFYAIAMYRMKDYKNAGIPVMPLIVGALATKVQIILYITAFLAAEVALTIYGFTGYVYLCAVLLAGGLWLVFGIRGFFLADESRWARKMFFISLLVLLTFSFVIPIDSLITHGILITW